MGESDVSTAGGPSLPEVERLVNLTGHEIVLMAQDVVDPCADHKGNVSEMSHVVRHRSWLPVGIAVNCWAGEGRYCPG
jgi:hypothetical protein